MEIYKPNIVIEDLSTTITNLYINKTIDKKMLSYLGDLLSDKKDYKTVAIYLYKRDYCKFKFSELYLWFRYVKNILPQNLEISFKSMLDSNEYKDIIMYIIKNDYVVYIYKDNMVKNVKSLRAELNDSNANKRRRARIKKLLKPTAVKVGGSIVR